jgi:hypothetical protein
MPGINNFTKLQALNVIIILHYSFIGLTPEFPGDFRVARGPKRGRRQLCRDPRT